MSWKIGEVSKRTGLTIRTLHFYEEIGLIGPVQRNQSGHRLYTSKDLLRLQQISALRQLGFPLPDMKSLLADSSNGIQTLIAKQITHIKQQRQTLDLLEQRLRKLDEQLSNQGSDNLQLDELLFDTLEAMTMYDKYFDEKTVSEMHSHEHKDADGNTSSIEDAWSQWTTQLKTLVDAGADPHGKEAQELMSHWQDLVTHLTGGDKQQLEAFNNLFHNEPQARLDHGIDDSMFELMGKATVGH